MMPPNRHTYTQSPFRVLSRCSLMMISRRQNNVDDAVFTVLSLFLNSLRFVSSLLKKCVMCCYVTGVV